MKKSPNTDDVSLRSAQSAGLGRKMGGDEANITKKLLWGTSKWLATPCDGRNIAIPPKKAQYDLIDNNSNGKSRFKCTKLSFRLCRIRLWLGVMLLVGPFSQSALGAPVQIALTNSIKEVEIAPQTGQLDSHRAFITRKTLKSAEASAILDFEVALKMRNFAELQGRVAHGERISASEMAAKYDPSPTDYEVVKNWLSSQGFEITRLDENHLAVFAQGKVSLIQSALDTSFARITYENVEYTSAITEPKIPATLAPLLVGINGLQPHIQMHKHLILRPNSLTGTNAPYLPSQIAQAYNASGLYSSSVTGAGQTIAIAIDTFPATSDLTSFWSTYSVNQTIDNISFIQVVSGTLPAPSGEETLDTEWSSSIAPGAKVRVYAAKTLTSSHLDQVYQQIYSDVVNHPEYGIGQLSVSYGIGETYTTQSQVMADDQYFAELASAGVTVFASSGDGGSTPGNGSNSDETGPLQAESPASDPNVTGVGGTTLALNSSGNESSEVVWNDSYGASGGGISEYFNRPYWQFGTGVLSGTSRLVPDVACSADPARGGVVILNGSQEIYGGTSWSSPTWAGFCALINQNRANASFPSMGVLGPYIYPQLGSANFRDIANGSNATSNSNGLYAATTGYDPATGIGVPNVQTLAQTLQTYTPTSQAAPSITNGPPPSATLNTAYTFTYTSTGYPAPTFSVTAGALPTGLTLSSAGVLSGAPTETGTYTGTVTASNGVSPAATQNFSISVQQAPSITNGPPPAAALNTVYNFTYTASGYPVPTFSVNSGALPTGLTLSSAGVISGTPTMSGIYTGTVTASNGAGTAATQNFSISVQQAPSITNGPPPSATLNTAYSFSYTTNGYPTPTVSVTSGTLPTGLVLSSGGVLSGTPTVTGTYSGTVTASNGIGSAATQNFNIVVGQAPAFTNGPPPATILLNTSYSFTYTSSGYPAATFSVTSGALPTGLALSSAGVLSGTPTVTGTYTGTVTASNGMSPSAAQNFSISVQQAPSITNGPPPAAALNTVYNFTYTASGYPVPTFSVNSGALPTGLTLSSAGVISGTPTMSGIYTGTVTASNGAGTAATQNFSISVQQAPSITNGPPPSATLNTAYSFSYTTNGYPVPTFSVTAGALPTGLTLSSAGVLSGTPTVTGTYTGTITASNGIGTVATQNFSIVVGQAPAFTNGPPPATVLLNTSYSFTYTSSGYPAAMFSVATGTLPTGLVLSSSGVLSGTPTATGTYTGTIMASNGVGTAAEQNFSISVQQAPAFTNGPPLAATLNTVYSFTYTTSGYPAPTFLVTSGALPTGLALSSEGVLSGTPTETGTYTGTITASNGIGSAATQNFSIIVGQAPSFTNGPPSATVLLNTSYNFTYNSTGYPTPTFSVASGSLPTGLSLSSAGVLSGTPTVTGTYTGKVNASNGVGTAATQNFSIIVGQAPAFTNGPPPATAMLNTPYSFTYTTSGYPASTFGVASGSLPPGLTLSTSGTISGAPTTGGVYSGTVTASNGVGTSVSQLFTLTVLTDFSQWEASYNTISSPTATPENDGVPNLFKYLFDIDPSQSMTPADRAALPVFGMTANGDLTLTFREYAFETGITINVQTSADLQTWATLTQSQTLSPTTYTIQQLRIDTSTNDPIMQIVIQASGASKQFIRLNVIQP